MPAVAVVPRARDDLADALEPTVLGLGNLRADRGDHGEAHPDANRQPRDKEELRDLVLGAKFVAPRVVIAVTVNYAESI